MEYLRKNYIKSMKLLVSCRNHKEPVSTNAPNYVRDIQCQADIAEECAYYNNMACVYLKMNRYSLATIYFRKALQLLSTSEMSSLVPSRLTLSQYKQDSNSSVDAIKTIPRVIAKNSLRICHTSDLLYNTGISLLHSHQPAEAYDCFSSCLSQFYSRPELWLRLAECCIYLVAQRQQTTNDSTFTYDVIPSAKIKKFIIRY
jgi:CCR4-NOT transcription complex subunit 10